MEGWDYPVVVVTAVHEDDRAGCLVGFTTQASIDPPRFRMIGWVIDHQPLGDHVGFLLEPARIDVASRGQGLTFHQACDIEAGRHA